MKKVVIKKHRCPERLQGAEWAAHMPFYVYILRSISNELYIGQTNNLYNREKQQVTKSEKAAKFIKDGTDFSLVYSEEYQTRTEAMRREDQLKRWSREKKKH